MSRRAIAKTDLKIEERIAVEEVRGEPSTLGHERERFALLYRVGKTVLSTAPEDLYPLALSLVFDCLEAERGALLLPEPGGELEAHSLRHRDARPLSQTELRIPTSIVREAVDTQMGILTSDATRDPRFAARESVQRGRVRSALCAPLWDGERVLGAFYLDSRVESYAFTRDDLLLLNGIANLVAMRMKQDALNDQLGEERIYRSNLERYHSPDVVELIMERARQGGEGPGLEEREVTVLFADLEGFTHRAESMDAALVADFLNAYYTLVTDVVFACGGSVNEYIGDSVMAIFGAPVVHRDHAERGVRAALELRRSLSEARLRDSDPLRSARIRIAVNTGRVVVGSLGPPHRLKYAVVGDAVNVAARLEHLGEPGTITLGEQTWRRVRDATPCLDLGETSVRGREKPVRAYRVDDR